MSVYNNYRNCPICEKENKGYLLKKKGYSLIKCCDCGMFYIANNVQNDALNKIYNEEYFTKKVYSKFELDSSYENSHAGKRDMALLRQLQSYIPSGKILDVGCGPGYFLRCAKKMGYYCYGIDISRWAASHAAKNKDLKIFHGELADARYEDDYFDFVIMSHVIEHVTNPIEILFEVFRILKKNGIAVVTIPTETESLVWKYGKIKDCINVPAHINYFSFSTFSKISAKAKFNIIYSKRIMNLFYNYNYLLNCNSNKKEMPKVENYYKKVLSKSNLQENLFFNIKKLFSFFFGLAGIGDELTMFLRK